MTLHDKSIYAVPINIITVFLGVGKTTAILHLLKNKPHSLLIESAGLGHPKEVLDVLNSIHYYDVLDIQQSITLVDERKLHDSRYINHDTFNQQIDIAEVIVGNKQDLYLDGDRALLKHYIADKIKQVTPCYSPVKINLIPLYYMVRLKKLKMMITIKNTVATKSIATIIILTNHVLI